MKSNGPTKDIFETWACGALESMFTVPSGGALCKRRYSRCTWLKEERFQDIRTKYHFSIMPGFR